MFISMILLVVFASILVVFLAIYQYNEENRDYHILRLERKEKNLKSHIDYVLSESPYPVTSKNFSLIFNDKIKEIKHIHNLQFSFFALDGTLLDITREGNPEHSQVTSIESNILSQLSKKSDHRHVEKTIENKNVYQSSYSYLLDSELQPLAILNINYAENNEFLAKELNEFLTRLFYTYMFILTIAIVIAFFLSRYITKPLNAISEKIKTTRINKQNEKIEIYGASQEISILVKSYNDMIDELQESTLKLAAGERNQAWQEMAKQVAHEIKNPLTPMKLSVQSFQRKFNPEDPNITIKVNEFNNILIQQIDHMTVIADSFSNFAEIPSYNGQNHNVVTVVQDALKIFSVDYIFFKTQKEEIIAQIDRTQFIRLITNLIKNSIQAISRKHIQVPKIVVAITSNNNSVRITIEDNGIGIKEVNNKKIFEPKFTTKTSGTGLGLAIVKNIVENHKGTIKFRSRDGEGTTFEITFPK